MRDSARYVKIVEWSVEDQCYVGSAPGLIYGGCHGDDEKAVFEELCQIVEEAIELYRVVVGHVFGGVSVVSEAKDPTSASFVWGVKRGLLPSRSQHE